MKLNLKNLPNMDSIRNLMIKAKVVRKEDNLIQIGLDIGTHSVKAVAINQSESKAKLIGFSVKSAEGDIIKAIKDAHAQLNLTQAKVVTSISGSGAVARYVEMPSMSPDELKSAVKFEAEKVIPYKLDDVILDSARIEDVGKNRMKVVIVAVKKDVVETHLKILEQAGLEPSCLDIDSFALMNAFSAAAFDNENVCGLVNIGAKRTNLNIIKGASSYLCRDIDIGGNDIIRLIASNYSGQEKDLKKIDEKLMGFEQLPDDEKAAMARYLEEVLSRLADEIRLSFDFYENQHAGGINKVYVSGGLASLEIVETFLKESLGRDTARWNSLAGVDISEGLDAQVLEKVQSQLAVSIGLGLRSIY
ncbi:MAG: type IV pilus assembly protein PilM [Candidatus Omnitrophota bacterium]